MVLPGFSSAEEWNSPCVQHCRSLADVIWQIDINYFRREYSQHHLCHTLVILMDSFLTCPFYSAKKWQASKKLRVGTAALLSWSQWQTRSPIADGLCPALVPGLVWAGIQLILSNIGGVWLFFICAVVNPAVFQLLLNSTCTASSSVLLLTLPGQHVGQGCRGSWGRAQPGQVTQIDPRDILDQMA